MANPSSTFIPAPQAPLVDAKGFVTIPWYQYFNQPHFQTFSFSGVLGVSSGGTGLASGNSGGVLAFSSTGALISSPTLNAYAIVLGGGPGNAPSTPIGLGQTNQVLHGNPSGSPSWSQIDLSHDLTGVLSVASGGTGLTGGSTGALPYFNSPSSMTSLAIGSKNYVLTSTGSSPQWAINEPDLATTWCYT